jgi:hypothetical protein
LSIGWACASSCAARDPAGAVGDLLRAGDLQALALLQRGDELAGVEQAVVRAGVQPGIAAAHDLDLELALLQVACVDLGDLELAARAGLDVGGDVAHLRVVEVQARDCVVALGLARLFLDADGTPLAVELDDAIAFRVVHVVGEDRGPAVAPVCAAQQRLEVVAVEDVVAQHQRAGRPPMKDRPRMKAWARPSGLGCTQ